MTGKMLDWVLVSWQLVMEKIIWEAAIIEGYFWGCSRFAGLSSCPFVHPCIFPVYLPFPENPLPWLCSYPLCPAHGTSGSLSHHPLCGHQLQQQLPGVFIYQPDSDAKRYSSNEVSVIYCCMHIYFRACNLHIS